MNRCTKVRALRSCSGDVHVARVVVSLVVHAVVGLTFGLIAHVVVVVFVVEFPQPFFCIWKYTLHRTPFGEKITDMKKRKKKIWQKNQKMKKMIKNIKKSKKKNQ